MLTINYAVVNGRQLATIWQDRILAGGSTARRIVGRIERPDWPADDPHQSSLDMWIVYEAIPTTTDTALWKPIARFSPSFTIEQIVKAHWSKQDA